MKIHIVVRSRFRVISAKSFSLHTTVLAFFFFCLLDKQDEPNKSDFFRKKEVGTDLSDSVPEGSL